MAIGRPEAIDGASLATAASAEDGDRRLSCFARNDGDPGSPRDLSRGVVPAGEESRSAPLRHRRSRLQPSFGQIKPLRGRKGARDPTEDRQGRLGPPTCPESGPGTRRASLVHPLPPEPAPASPSIRPTRQTLPRTGLVSWARCRRTAGLQSPPPAAKVRCEAGSNPIYGGDDRYTSQDRMMRQCALSGHTRRQD